MKRKLLFLASLFSFNVFVSAVSADIFRSIEFHDKKSIYKWLQSKPDLDVVNSDGQSVLIKAVKSENKNAVKQFIAHEINVNKIDKFGKTALDYAVELENRKIAKILVKAKACVTSQESYQKCKKLLSFYRGWNCFYKIFKTICFVAIGCVAFISCIGFFGCIYAGAVHYGSLYLLGCATSIFSIGVYLVIAKLIDRALCCQYESLDVSVL